MKCKALKNKKTHGLYKPDDGIVTLFPMGCTSKYIAKRVLGFGGASDLAGVGLEVVTVDTKIIGEQQAEKPDELNYEWEKLSFIVTQLCEEVLKRYEDRLCKIDDETLLKLYPLHHWLNRRENIVK